MPAPNSGTAPRTTAFSGRYANLPPVAEAAASSESPQNNDAPAAIAGPGGSAAGLPSVPTHDPGTQQQGASGEDEENPYLADTPYYLSTLKGKAHEAKTEILSEAPPYVPEPRPMSAAERRASASGGVLPPQPSSTNDAARTSTAKPSQQQQLQQKAPPQEKWAWGQPKPKYIDDNNLLDGSENASLADVVPFDQDQELRPPFKTAPQCRDALFALLFLTHLLTMAVVAVVQGVPEYTVLVTAAQRSEVTKHGLDLVHSSGSGTLASGSSDPNNHHLGNYRNDDDYAAPLHHPQHASSGPSPSGALLAVLVSAGLAVFFTLMLFELALASPVAMLQLGLGGAVSSCALLAAWSILAGPDVIGALAFSVATAFAICFAISVQDRMAFAAANLSCAAAAIRKHREIVAVALGGLCAQFLWLCVWLLALLGCALSHHRERQESLPPSSAQYAAYEASTGWPGTERAAETNAAERQEEEHQAAAASSSSASLSKTGHESSSSRGSSSSGSGDGDNAKSRYASSRLLKKKHNHKHDEPIAPSPTASSYTPASILNDNYDGYDDDGDDDSNGASPSLAGLSELLAANSDAAAAAAAAETSADDLPSSFSSEASSTDRSSTGSSSTDSSSTSNKSNTSSSNNTNEAPESDPLGYYYSYYDDNSSTNDEPTGSHGGAPNFGQGHKYGKNKDSASGIYNAGEPDEISVSEYYGLGAGCKTIFVDHKDVADFHLESLTNGTYGVYCACNHGSLLSLGTCDSSDFFYVELAQNAWLYVLFAASLFWGFQVIAGVVHVTSAGAVASWWFDTAPPLPPAAAGPSAVKGAGGLRSGTGNGNNGSGGGAYASVPSQDPEQGQGSSLLPPPPPPQGHESYSPGAGTGHKVYGITGPPGSPGATGAAARRADMQQRLAEFKVRKSLLQTGSAGVGGAAGGAGGAGDEEGGGVHGGAEEEGGGGGEQRLAENEAEAGGAAKKKLLATSSNAKKSAKAAARSARAKGNGTDARDDNSVDTAVAFRALQGVRNSANVSVVHASLYRALGPSFGSVCFGAAFVSAMSSAEACVRTVRTTCFSVAELNGERTGPCCCCLLCVDCLLISLRDILQFFNRWAFTYVAIYGDHFKAAGKSTHALLKRRGFGLVATDTLCSTALMLVAVFLSVASGVVAYWMSSVFGARGFRQILVLTAALSAFMMCSCATAALDAGALAVLVCFAHDPRPCAAAHPEEFAELLNAWLQFYGNQCSLAGYTKLKKLPPSSSNRNKSTTRGGR